MSGDNDLQTPERILTTAEEMFAEQGYWGVSLRAITRASGVNIAAIHYHFGSKQELLERIFEKRCGPMNAERMRLLSECVEGPDRPPLLEQILEAYLRPSLIWPDDPDGARQFLRLRAVLSHEVESLAADLISQHFNQVSRAFASAICNALPQFGEEEVYWRFQFLLSAQYYTLSNPGRVTILSEGKCDPSECGSGIAPYGAFLCRSFPIANTPRERTRVCELRTTCIHGSAVMTSPVLGGRFQILKPSATVEMSERVRVARSQGRDIIAMSSGDPNLDTNPRIIEAAERALRGGATHYTSAFGEPQLRGAIAAREFERSGVAYAPDDIIVTPGGKFALLSALMSVVEPGNDVLIPQPGWVSYGPCVRLSGGNAVPVPALDRFDVAAFRAALTPTTRAIIVNSPVNPTGRVLTQNEVEHLVEFATLHNLWIIFDQVYTDLIDGTPATFPQALPEGFERTLVVDSLSKSFGMTGWRLGFLAMPPGIAQFVVKFIQHSIYCVPPFVQAAGTRALELAPELLPRYRGMFYARVLRATAALSRVPGVSITAPDAGFFLFPSVDGDDVTTARAWLDDLGIAVLPGSAFGPAGAGHLRIALSCAESDLDAALDRISRTGGICS